MQAALVQAAKQLTALAETQTFSPDPTVWDRGRRARRTSRLARGAALAVIARRHPQQDRRRCRRLRPGLPHRSDVTEHPRLALLTSPDIPRSQWVVREFLPRLPPGATSFAVDLIPDLTGDPDQELTRDFTATQTPSDGGSRVPVVAGGVMALLVGIAFIRMMQKRA